MIDVDLPATAAKRRTPCWIAWGFIVNATPTKNTDFQPDADLIDHSRLFMRNEIGKQILRYQPWYGVKFSSGEFLNERLWDQDFLQDPFSPSGGWRRRTFSTDLALSPYDEVTLTVEREILIHDGNQANEKLPTLTFKIEDRTGDFLR